MKNFFTDSVVIARNFNRTLQMDYNPKDMSRLMRLKIYDGAGDPVAQFYLGPNGIEALKDFLNKVDSKERAEGKT